MGSKAPQTQRRYRNLLKNQQQLDSFGFQCTQQRSPPALDNDASTPLDHGASSLKALTAIIPPVLSSCVTSTSEPVMRSIGSELEPEPELELEMEPEPGPACPQSALEASDIIAERHSAANHKVWTLVACEQNKKINHCH